ncbi:mitochondrial inner membrane protease subunit 2 [Dermatophagoides pteronyssinus]|uniref:mitochondrial inner membrane protease subunit 2 n=1 Tax=Dermatophagoides pteronyssinus TaxID=6956 RepID=UPI003F66D09E
MSSVFSIKNLVRTLSLSVPLTLIFFDNIAYIARVDGVSMQPTLNPCDYDENNFNDNDNTDDDEIDLNGNSNRITQKLKTAFNDNDRRSINIKNLLFNRFNSSDLIWLSHWATRNYQIERGYIVSLISPNNPNQIIIKRVIGVEGDTVVTRRNFKFETIRIPKGHCWVEGDNHTKSMDSNIFGPVAVGLITAQAKYIIWPPKRWQSLTKQMPNDRILHQQFQSSFRKFKGSYYNGDPCIIELNVDPLSSSIVQHHHSPSSTSSSSKLGLITTILDEDSF